VANLKDVENRLKQIEERLGIVDKHYLKFEDILERCDKRTLMYIWQGIESSYIGVAMIGLNRQLVETVKESLSKNRWEDLTEHLRGPIGKTLTLGNVQSCREHIIQKVWNMHRIGAIVIPVSKEEAKKFFPRLKKTKKKTVEKPFEIGAWLSSIFNRV
jgi:flagellar motor switch protein FliG